MSYISDILYWISTGLMVPVIVLLIFLFVRALILLGGFYGQYMQIRRTERALRVRLSKLTPETVHELVENLPSGPSAAPIARYIRRMYEVRDCAPQIEHIIAESEISADKDMSLSNTLAKMGPTLGLMGTLIPMGPALVGLSTGDIASMAYNMQVAFATTVVGLFASAVGFVTRQAKKRWYMRELTDLELVAALLEENCENENDEKRL